MRRWCFTDISGTYIAKNCYCFTWEQLSHLVCNQLSGHGHCMNLGVKGSVAEGYIVLLFCFLVFATLFGDRWALITIVTWWLFSTSVSIRGFHRPLSVFVYSFCTSKHILCIPACVSLRVHKVGQNRRKILKYKTIHHCSGGYNN